ncbi:MAG: hypothetical protein GX491_23150 [Chloroflexi bacterium]|nr:hypothetical protein [Chloroflexota bacterium]
MVQGQLFGIKNTGDVIPLGYLAWYTVPTNLHVTREELEKAFVTSGISTSKMPDPIKPHDVFRRATRKVQRERIPVPTSNNTFYNFLVREIRCDNDEILRYLVAETVDSENAVLTYQEVGAFRFRRTIEQMHFSPLTSVDPELQPLVDGIKSQAEENFRQGLKYYEGDHIRRMITSMLNDLSPTLVRPSGAVYFVPNKYKEDITAMEVLNKALGAEFITLPVIDANNAREMVLHAFKKQTTATIRELTEALKEPNITAYKVGSLMNRAKELLSEVEEYENLLNNKLLDLRSQTEIVQLQMKSVLAKIAA